MGGFGSSAVAQSETETEEVVTEQPKQVGPESLEGREDLHETWLTKQSRYIGSWRNRWSVLDQDSKMLYTFPKKQLYSGATEQIHLGNATLDEKVDNPTGKVLFKLTDQTSKRVFLFDCGEEKLRDAWLDILKKVVLDVTPGKDDDVHAENGDEKEEEEEPEDIDTPKEEERHEKVDTPQEEEQEQEQEQQDVVEEDPVVENAQKEELPEEPAAEDKQVEPAPEEAAVIEDHHLNGDEDPDENEEN